MGGSWELLSAHSENRRDWWTPRSSRNPFASASDRRTLYPPTSPKACSSRSFPSYERSNWIAASPGTSRRAGSAGQAHPSCHLWRRFRTSVPSQVGASWAANTHRCWRPSASGCQSSSWSRWLGWLGDWPLFFPLLHCGPLPLLL